MCLLVVPLMSQPWWVSMRSEPCSIAPLSGSSLLRMCS
jgi:hypothetical protein